MDIETLMLAKSYTKGQTWLAERYVDLNFEGILLRSGASAPDLIQMNGTTIYKNAFDGVSTLEQLYAGGEVPHNYIEGTDGYFHIHWRPTTNVSGNVKWNIDYIWENDGTSDLTVQTISCVCPSGTTAFKIRFDEVGTISGVGKVVGSHISFRLYRDPSDSQDTYGADAILDSVGIHFKVAGYGSKYISGN